ncbi:MAG: nucleotidyltransferase domain-containing protein, partial [Bacillota bacterium]
NIGLFNCLAEVAALFERNRVPVILLKGAHLAELVYGNLALRPMSDIDLLARESDLARIHDLLIAAGFRFSGVKPQSNTKHLPPYHKEGGVLVEVHFHLADPPYSERINLEDLWARAGTARLQEQQVKVLSPEDLLLHICQHTCIQHGFDNGLTALLDTAWIMERYRKELDWQQLFTRARQWGIERAVFLMLVLTEKLLATALPPEAQKQIRTGKEFTAALGTAEELIFSRPVSPVKTTRYLARFFGKTTWGEKLSYMKARALPAGTTVYRGEKKVADLNQPARFLFYLQRTAALSRRYGKTIWLGLRRDPQTIQAMQDENKKNRLRDWLSQTW